MPFLLVLCLASQWTLSSVSSPIKQAAPPQTLPMGSPPLPSPEHCSSKMHLVLGPLLYSHSFGDTVSLLWIPSMYKLLPSTVYPTCLCWTACVMCVFISYSLCALKIYIAQGQGLGFIPCYLPRAWYTLGAQNAFARIKASICLHQLITDFYTHFFKEHLDNRKGAPRNKTQ